MISTGAENSETDHTSTSTPSSKRSASSVVDGNDQSSTSKKQCGKKIMTGDSPAKPEDGETLLITKDDGEKD